MNMNATPGTANRSIVIILAALVLAEVVSAVESTMILTALRALYRIFGDPIMVGWIVTAFLLVAAASASVCARLGDMFGRKQVMLIVLAVSCVGSLISAFSTGVEGVILGRAIQGLAGAVLPLCFGLVRENLPLGRVPFGIGVVSAAAFVSAGLAMFVGGVIVDHLSWHWIFYLGAGTAVLAFIAIALGVPRSKRAVSDQRVDILGAVLLVPAVTGLLLALSQAKVWGWGDGRTLSLTTGCMVVLIVWVLHELRLKNPLIDVRLLTNRQLALGNLSVILIALGPLQSGIMLSLLLQQPTWTGVGLGLSATLSGLILAPPLMLAVFAGPGCGLLAARYGARRPALLACMLLLIGWGGIALYHGSIWFVAPMVILQGLGMAMAYSAVPMLIVEVAPEDRTSEVTGLSSVIRYLFTAIGSQLVAVMLATATVSDPAHGQGSYPAPSAFALALVVTAVLSLLSFLVTLALPHRGGKAEQTKVDNPLAQATA
jgi:MFS family permease